MIAPHDKLPWASMTVSAMPGVPTVSTLRIRQCSAAQQQLEVPDVEPTI